MKLFLLCFRQALEIGLAGFIAISVLKGHRRLFAGALAFSLFAGICLGILLFPPAETEIGLATNLAFLCSTLCLLLPLFRPPEKVIALLLPLLLFVFPPLQTTILLKDGAQLNGISIYIHATLAFVFSFLVFYAGFRAFGEKLNPGNFMNPLEMVLFITALRFLLGSETGSSERQIVPSLQRGLQDFLSGFIPLLKNALLIPGVENIETGVGAVLDFFRSSRVAMATTALFLLTAPVYLLGRLLIKPEPESAGTEKCAAIRKRIALHRKELMKRGIPIMTSFILLTVLLHSANLTLNPSYEPRPVALVAEDGRLRIPLTDATGDISDGKLRKYSLSIDNVTYRILVMMRPDGEVVAALDACEICPPRGYVQRGKYLICTYCNTPIPAETFGHKGGCNPIPLASGAGKDFLLIPVSEIVGASEKAGSKFAGRH